jgi:hypothetical protein
MPDGPVYTNLAWATYKALLLAYCDVDADDEGVSDYDALLEELFKAGKRKADEYLNNPFEVLNPTIAFSGVEECDYITVNGQTYTVADALDEDELEFALGADDSETADNFCTLVNSTTLGGSYGAVGVAGVLATNSEGTVTLTRRYNNVADIEVSSSDEDKLLVRQVRTAIDIPECVAQWLFQFVKRHFDNRDALIQDNITGKSVKMWLSMKSEQSGMTDNYDLISLHRIPVGL